MCVTQSDEFLFISDTGNDRIIVTKRDGTVLKWVSLTEFSFFSLNALLISSVMLIEFFMSYFCLLRHRLAGQLLFFY